MREILFFLLKFVPANKSEVLHSKDINLIKRRNNKTVCERIKKGREGEKLGAMERRKAGRENKIFSFSF